jgi:SsrA-binding protein
MTDLVSNKKARHNFEILETFEAGIVLVGTEIKSLRAHGGSLDDAYLIVNGGEIFIKNLYIGQYEFGNIHNHEERRERKLLMHHREILKMKQANTQKGCALIALSIYLKAGRAKLQVAIAKGKKLHDKRQSIKEEEMKRDIQKAMRRE